MADTRVQSLLVHGVAGSAKKLIAAIGKAAIDGEGEQPWLITLADISRRTGWTFSEIDDQDASEVMPALLGQSIRDALRRIDNYIATQGQLKPSENDLEIYGDVVRIMEELDDDG